MSKGILITFAIYLFSTLIFEDAEFLPLVDASLALILAALFAHKARKFDTQRLLKGSLFCTPFLLMATASFLNYVGVIKTDRETILYSFAIMVFLALVVILPITTDRRT